MSDPHVGRPRPLVSFCFDDFPRSAVQVGGSVLEALDVRATYYASMRFLDAPTPMGDGFTATDLIELVARGHELGCHTFEHLDARTTGAAAYEASIVQNRRALARIVGVAVESFAYPYGAITPEAAEAAARHSRSCRGTVPSINIGSLQRQALRAQPLYSHRRPPVAVADLVRQSQHACGWLIFYTHDVSADPSPWGCTPDLLQEAAGLALDSGAIVLPIREALVLAAPAPPPLRDTDAQGDGAGSARLRNPFLRS